MHRYHCVHRTFSNSTPRLSPSTDQLYISLLSLDQSKLYFSDICKSWRVNIYLVFLERKGGPTHVPQPLTVALSLRSEGRRKASSPHSSTNMNLFLRKQSEYQFPFLSANIPYFTSSSLSMVIR